MATNIKFEIGNKTSSNFKGGTAGRVMFAKNTSFADSTKNAYNLYYDNGSTLDPVEVETAQAAKKLINTVYIDGMSFNGEDHISKYGSCSTAAGTAEKAVTVLSIATPLRTGTSIYVKFSNANSAANPKLNVNSSGAKSIYYKGAALASGQYWGAGDIVQFVYDGTNWIVVGTIKDNNTTYSVSGTAPLTLTLSADKKTITGSISTGTTGKVGVVKQHTANDCTSYTSDEGATTPAAVKKAVGLFGDQWYSPLGHSHDAVTYATYLALQTTSNLAGQTNKLSTRASSWGGQGPNTVKSIPWRQAWVDSSISTDSGDMVLGLRPSEYSPGGTELCMFIDGDYYAMGNKVLNTANYSTYLDNRYVTLDTTQTIGGAKTFTSATTTIHHKLQLTRSSSVTEGRLSFYDAGYNTWIEYMSNPAPGCCPTKGTPSTLGNVTSWARRSIIENSTGYGWIWEACANGYEGTPNPIMALSSNTGQMTLAGTTVALNSGSGKIQYNTTTKSIDFIFA